MSASVEALGIGGFSLVVALALGVSLVLVWHVSRVRADRRWREVWGRYAEREEANWIRSRSISGHAG